MYTKNQRKYQGRADSRPRTAEVFGPAPRPAFSLWLDLRHVL